MKGRRNGSDVKVKILIEEKENKKLHRIEYEGNYRGLKKVEKIVKSIKK